MRVLIVAICLIVCVFGRGYDMEGMEEAMVDDDWKPGDNMVLMNFDEECMAKLNKMIHYHIESVFQYIAMATWFRRYDVDFVGMSLMYNSWARMKLNMAKMMMMYIVKRGGTIEFMDVKKPKETMWTNPADALKTSLKTERELMEMVNMLAKHAHEDHDTHLVAFLEQHMTNTQADYIFEIAAYIKKLERGGAKFGLSAINMQMIKKYKEFKDCESDAEKYKWNY